MERSTAQTWREKVDNVAPLGGCVQAAMQMTSQGADQPFIVWCSCSSRVPRDPVSHAIRRACRPAFCTLGILHLR